MILYLGADSVKCRFVLGSVGVLIGSMEGAERREIWCSRAIEMKASDWLN